jgi:hypothetical protein
MVGLGQIIGQEILVRHLHQLNRIFNPSCHHHFPREIGLDDPEVGR